MLNNFKMVKNQMACLLAMISILFFALNLNYSGFLMGLAFSVYGIGSILYHICHCILIRRFELFFRIIPEAVPVFVGYLLINGNDTITYAKNAIPCLIIYIVARILASVIIDNYSYKRSKSRTGEIEDNDDILNFHR